nr:AraC family ligand binding domain-containing protein [Paenibacillus terrae]
MIKEFHHAFEILIVLDGAQETLIENEQYIIGKDDILLIPPGFEHTNRCISANSMTYFCAHFDIDEPSLRMKIMKDCDWVYKPSSPYYERLKRNLEKWLAQVILFELLQVLVDIQPSNADLRTHQTMTTVKYAKEIAEAIKGAFKKMHGKERKCRFFGSYPTDYCFSWNQSELWFRSVPKSVSYVTPNLLIRIEVARSQNSASATENIIERDRQSIRLQKPLSFQQTI